MTVNVLLEDSFDGHQGNDLYDPERALYRVFRVRKQTTLHEFLEQLSESLVSLYIEKKKNYQALNQASKTLDPLMERKEKKRIRNTKQFPK